MKRQTNLSQSTDENDACTKSYVDSKIRTINSLYALNVNRYYDYFSIKNNYKPTFWISGYYNSKFLIIHEELYGHTNNSVEIRGNGYVIKGTLIYERNLKTISFY